MDIGQITGMCLASKFDSVVGEDFSQIDDYMINGIG